MEACRARVRFERLYSRADHGVSIDLRQRLSMKRIHPKRRNGLFNKDAPFWRGERAEHIVRERVKGYQKKKPRKKK